MTVQDYYNILGVGRNATQLDIENAYEYFKTLQKSGQIDPQRWQMVEEAYDILASIENRMLYDEVLKQEATPIQSFSESSIPVIDQSSAETQDVNTSGALLIGIIAAVILAVTVIIVVLTNVSEEQNNTQESINYINTLNVTSRFTATPTLTLTPTPTRTSQMTIVATEVSVGANQQRCQVTNTSENAVTIYSAMAEDSNLDVFLMPAQSIEIYRESDDAEWYQIASDQIIEPGITITDTADEFDVYNDYLQAKDVQLDFCTEAEDNG